MREILFRGKALDGGKWVTGWHVEACFGSWPLEPAIIPSEDAKRGCYRPVAVHHSTVGQFTGLYDKDGKRIFEGDFVKFENEVFVVEYIAGFAAFSLRHPTNMRQAPPITTITVERMEVIGNRWDNPELLK